MTSQWFNPIAWIALRKLEEATEWRCDDFAWFHSERGPRDLIKTLLAVHDSTESLGLYLSSFAKINVITRIQRLHNTHSRKENTIMKNMKKTLLLTLFLAFLTAATLQVRLTAKTLEVTAEPQSPVTNVAEEEKQPALDAETEKLLALAESMVALPDVTVERLRDLDRDLYAKMNLNMHMADVFYERLVAILDKMYSLEPTDETLRWVISGKFAMLRNMAYYSPTDEAIRALEEFASETHQSQNEVIAQYEEIANETVLRAKLFRLGKSDASSTADQFLKLRANIIDFIKEHRKIRLSIADEIAAITPNLYEKNVVTREQMLETFTLIVTALKESPQARDRDTQPIQERVETKLAFLLAEGKTPEITGTDMNDKPFEWNVYKGKTVVMAFTSSWFGGREMQEILELSEEFAGHGLEYVTYVKLNGKDRGHNVTDDEQWLEMCVNRLNYPGMVLTQFQSSETAIGSIVEWLGQRSYSSVFPQFVLIDKDGKIAALGRKVKMREKLSELFGKPSEAAIARGLERSKVYRDTPKPCTANLFELVLAVHNYYDVNKIMPPAYTMDDKGNKLHSWRVHLLPWLGYADLYKQIRLDEPWNSEYNKQFNDMVLPVFQCHETVFADNPKPITTYAAIVGPEAPFEENGKLVGFIDIGDGLSNTLMFVERATPVHWMDPTDITFDEAVKGIGVSANGIAAPHQGGGNCAFCDGSTRFLPKDIDLKLLRAIITRAGGELVLFPE